MLTKKMIEQKHGRADRFVFDGDLSMPMGRKEHRDEHYSIKMQFACIVTLTSKNISCGVFLPKSTISLIHTRSYQVAAVSLQTMHK